MSVLIISIPRVRDDEGKLAGSLWLCKPRDGAPYDQIYIDVS